MGNLFSAKIEEAGLDLLFEIDKNIPQRLLGDSLRLTQVLNNLVGNAIKFTPRGEIVISAETVCRADDRVQVRFTRARHAASACPTSRPIGCSRCSRRPTTRSRRKYGGTGLGLAICKRLVELMDGTISVSSAPGRGQHVHLYRQLRRAKRERRTYRPAPHSRHAHAGGRRPADITADPAADPAKLALPGRDRFVRGRRLAQAAPRRSAGAL